MVGRCVYLTYTKLVYQRHRIVLAEAFGPIILAVVKINLVRHSVLLYAKAEALLYGCCVRVGIPDQERYYTVGPGIKEHRQPWPDCPGSVCALDEHIHKMMI